MSGECDRCRLNNVNHPWSQFLHARAVAMNWMREEMGRSNAEIAMALSMDEIQVRLILMQWGESVTPSSCISMGDEE